VYDTVNATIGQGYMLINPMQLAVMAARLASGKLLMPNFLFDPRRAPPGTLGVRAENIEVIRNAMSAVVNDGGTGGAARISVPGILMAGKTGTAQSRGIRNGQRNNASLPFRSRDHALFQGFAPYDNPRYAIGTIIEHGGHLNRIEDAPMISGDVLSYLFDKAGALERLATYEEGWGGDPRTRLKRQMDSYRAAKGMLPVLPQDEVQANAAAANSATVAAQPVQTDGSTAAAVASPAPEREAAPSEEQPE
jgi:penicillin-binding protein 2